MKTLRLAIVVFSIVVLTSGNVIAREAPGTNPYDTVPGTKSTGPKDNYGMGLTSDAIRDLWVWDEELAEFNEEVKAGSLYYYFLSFLQRFAS